MGLQRVWTQLRLTTTLLCRLPDFSYTWCMHGQSCLTLCDPRTTAHQASLFMGFSRQEYCSEFPFPPPEDLPDPEIQLASPVSSVLVGKLFYHWATWEALVTYGRSLIFLSQLLKLLGIATGYPILFCCFFSKEKVLINFSLRRKRVWIRRHKHTYAIFIIKK